MRYLKITLSGVLHHYSAGSHISLLKSKYYKTERCPTKNAVIGMISAAIGYERDDPEIQKLKDTLELKFQRDPEMNRCKSAFSIYIDDQNKQFGIDGEEYTLVDGKKSRDKRTEIKQVEYLQCARFFVFVGADEQTLKRIHHALLKPKYKPYLGKKSCPVNRPLVDYEFSLIREEELPDVYDCP